MNLKPSCVTLESISALNEHLKPRYIYVITPKVARCGELLAAAANVRCVDENSVIPGVTWPWMSARLLSLYPKLQAEGYEKGRTPTGWYLQQAQLWLLSWL